MDKEKPLEFRILELFYSLSILKDCSKLVYERKHYQMIPIYGQLRSLLVKPPKDISSKNKRQKNTIKSVPLLLSLMEELKIDLQFYSRPLFPFNERPDTVLGYQKLEFSIDPKPNFVLVKLDEFINKCVFVNDGNPYSIQDLFKNFANKFGGSHYDKSAPTAYTDIYPLKNKGLNLLNEQLLCFSDILIKCGAKIIKTISDFSLIVGFEVCSNPEETTTLFNVINTDARLSLMAKEKDIFLNIVDEIGVEVQIDFEKKLEQNVRYLFVITHKIVENLESEITVHINGQMECSYRIDPLFFNRDTIAEVMQFNSMPNGVDLKIYQIAQININEETSIDDIQKTYYEMNNLFPEPLQIILKGQGFSLTKEK